MQMLTSQCFRLEFLMGSTSTKNGALRASLGYPNPWKINYVEIGNEDNLSGGQVSYSAYRFAAFYDAVHAKYPNLTVIASTSGMSLPGNAGQDFHVYNRPNLLAGQFDFFDHWSRSHKTLIGRQITTQASFLLISSLLGEYANIEPNAGGDPGVDWNIARPTFPTWIGAVSEGVFAIGAERNSDMIIGASYAPAFCNLNNHQWVPGLIGWSLYSLPNHS
jgi:alpha-L-arabinofuranosidase